MDAISDEALAAALAGACSQARSGKYQNLHSVSSALNQVVSNEQDPLRALITGLDYHLRLDDESRETYGPFGPLIESSGGTYPVPLEEIEQIAPGVFGVWERAVRLAPLALVRGRFADLLWEANWGERPHEHARRAIDEYIDASGADFGSPMERCEAIRRAVEIASMINDSTRRARAIEAAATLADHETSREEGHRGVPITLLTLFVEDRPERRPPQVEQLLADAIGRFGDDPWALRDLIDLKARLLPPGERSALREHQVQAFRNIAGRATGPVRYGFLHHAIEHAERHGLHELADEVRREVRRWPPARTSTWPLTARARSARRSPGWRGAPIEATGRSSRRSGRGTNRHAITASLASPRTHARPSHRPKGDEPMVRPPRHRTAPAARRRAGRDNRHRARPPHPVADQAH